MIDDDRFMPPRKLTHQQASLEQHLYWSSKTVSERLAGMTDLNRSLLRMRGIEIDEEKPDFTPRRAPRRPR